MTRVSPAKRWCFTLNNPGPDTLVDLMVHLKSLGADFVVGEEVAPKTGTPHLQGTIRRVGKWRPLPLCKSWGGKAHWEKCQGTWLENVLYCSKELHYHASFDVPAYLRAKMPLEWLEERERALRLEAAADVHAIWVSRGCPAEDCSADSLVWVEWARTHEALAARSML